MSGGKETVYLRQTMVSTENPSEETLEKEVNENLSALEIYMHELTRWPVLSAKEENKLARSISDTRETLEDQLYTTRYGRTLLLETGEKARKKDIKTSDMLAEKRMRYETNREEVMQSELNRLMRGIEEGYTPEKIRAGMRNATLNEQMRKRLLGEFYTALRQYAELAEHSLEYRRREGKTCHSTRLNTYSQKFGVYPSQAKAYYDGLMGLDRMLKCDTDRLTCSNLRLVANIAKKFLWRGMSLEEMLPEGNTGLMKAVERYDRKMGRFTTYATWWIRQAIQRAISDKLYTIRLPVHMLEKMNKINKSRSAYYCLHGYCQTDGFADPQALARMTGLKLKHVLRCLDLAKIRYVQSLDAPLPTEEGTTDMYNFVRDEHIPSALEEAERDQQREKVDAALKMLGNAKQLRVMMMRHFEEKTLAQGGTEFGVSRERVRQIQAATHKKLRNPEYGLEELRDNT